MLRARGDGALAGMIAIARVGVRGREGVGGRGRKGVVVPPGVAAGAIAAPSGVVLLDVVELELDT